MGKDDQRPPAAPPAGQEAPCCCVGSQFGTPIDHPTATSEDVEWGLGPPPEAGYSTGGIGQAPSLCLPCYALLAEPQVRRRAGEILGRNDAAVTRVWEQIRRELPRILAEVAGAERDYYVGSRATSIAKFGFSVRRPR